MFEVARVGSTVKSLAGDVRDGEKLAAALREAEPEIVFHMAAQSLVRKSYTNPVDTYSTNVMGTVNLLEAIRQSASVRAVVNITTDKCYDNKEWLWGYREDEALGGHDPYSSSKACSELVSSAYRNSFFNSKATPQVALATARAGNVIGGGDWSEDRLIPDILRALQAGNQVDIRNPQSIRPWQHVLEPLSGYMTLAEKLFDSAHGSSFAQAYNFGPRDEDTQPVRWVVEKLTQLWDGSRPSWQTTPGANPHEAHYLKLDSSKARTHLGWKTQWTLEQALQAVSTWHKAYLNGGDMLNESLQQIATYAEFTNTSH
jgi:CDP-glucose 4,6-dehydratase